MLGGDDLTMKRFVVDNSIRFEIKFLAVRENRKQRLACGAFGNLFFTKYSINLFGEFQLIEQTRFR